MDKQEATLLDELWSDTLLSLEMIQDRVIEKKTLFLIKKHRELLYAIDNQLKAMSQGKKGLFR